MGTLYVVATPIGNLEDVTLRALRVLREVDLLLAEDTRRTRILLERHGIPKRPRSFHSHNEAARLAEVLAALGEEAKVALVSDAGTPLVSDPGERLVAAASAAGHTVVPVPGPSAVLAALSVSGFAPVPFTFLGFLPRRTKARESLLAPLRTRPETLVLFESPQRLGPTLRALQAAFGERAVCVARELTKLHEEVVRGPLSELAERFKKGARGEVTLVVAGAEAGSPEAARLEDASSARAEGVLNQKSVDSEKLEEQVRELSRQGLSSREIARVLAPAVGLRKRDVYALAVRLRNAAAV